MPFPNEHSCRLNPPGKYTRIRRVNADQRHDGKAIDVIYGRKPDGKSEIQALRYGKETWTASSARSHCRSRGGSFEPATGASSQQTLKAPMSAFAFAVDSEAFSFAAIDGNRRGAQMHALTGEPLQHWFHGAVIFDLAGLKPSKKKLPGLINHNPALRASVWTDFQVDKHGLVVSGYFLKNKHGAEILEDIDGGFPFQGSIQFDPQASKFEKLSEGLKAEVNGREVEGPMLIVRETEIKEVSWCVHGVDRGTSGTALADASEQVEVTVTSAGKGPEMAELTDEERRDIALEYMDGLSADELAEVSGVATLRVAAQEEAAKAEKDRVKMCAEAFKDDAAFALKVYLDGTDIKDARIEFAEAEAKRLREENEKLHKVIPGSEQEAAGQEFSDSEAAEAAARERAEAEGAEDDPVTKFEARKAELIKTGLSEGQATKHIAHEDPELRAAYVAKINAG